MPSKRFRALHDEFFATSTRFRLAQKPKEKLALLSELQRIVQESKRELVDPNSKNADFRQSAAPQVAVNSCQIAFVRADGRRWDYFFESSPWK